jgi:uncharacterized membrane protein SpoIIM required for sporulation
MAIRSGQSIIAKQLRVKTLRSADEFYQTRKNDWEKLTSLLDRCQNGNIQLSSEEIKALGQLYRLATSDLALAQRDFPQQRVTIYLNQLVARAHAVIYRGEPVAWRRIWRFIAVDYPRLFRQSAPFILIAFLIFAIPAATAAALTVNNPGAARWLLPGQVQQLIPMIEERQLWVDIPVNERPYTSSFIMQNNIQVTILAFGGGLLAGLFTVWVMAFNGLVLGGITGLTAHYEVAFELWTFVIGHGVIELSVIFIAGGAGLMLGWGLIYPGLARRGDSVAQAARKAVRLVGGGIPLLVIAGLIEGFLSPAENIAWYFKWGFGLFSGLVLYSYLLLAGRQRSKQPRLQD